MKNQISNYNILTESELNYFNKRYKCHPDETYQNVICETYRVTTAYITKHPVNKTWYIYNKLLHKKLTLSPYVLQIYVECKQLNVDVTPFDVRNVIFTQLQNYQQLSDEELIILIQHQYKSTNKLSQDNSNIPDNNENNLAI